MAHVTHRGALIILGSVLSLACGGSEVESDRGAFSGLEPAPAPPQNSNLQRPPEVEPTPLPPPVAEAPPVLGLPAPETEPAPTEPVPPVVTRCQAPSGVSARPRDLIEAVALLNALPRPTTLPCFLEALERPLQVYMTRSDQSLQPSPGARSPRTFIVNEPLVMSIVFEGKARVTLELGYRTAETRSIKTELVFPLDREIAFANLFDEIKEGSVSRCSACHTSETVQFNGDIQAEAYESDIYPPFEVYEVDLESVRAESTSCDSSAEAERCALLTALFNHGDVVAAPRGILFSVL